MAGKLGVRFERGYGHHGQPFSGRKAGAARPMRRAGRVRAAKFLAGCEKIRLQQYEKGRRKAISRRVVPSWVSGAGQA
jgi:hypothetical protein